MAKTKIVCPKGHGGIGPGDKFCRKCKRKLVGIKVQKFENVVVVTEPLEIVSQCPNCSWDIDKNDNCCAGCGLGVKK